MTIRTLTSAESNSKLTGNYCNNFDNCLIVFNYYHYSISVIFITYKTNHWFN